MDRVPRGFGLEAISDETSADETPALPQGSTGAAKPVKTAMIPAGKQGNRSGSVDSTTTAGSVIISRNRGEEGVYPLEGEWEGEEEMRGEPTASSDVEKFIQSVLQNSRRLQSEYEKSYTECNEFLRNEEIWRGVWANRRDLRNRLDGIDSKDTESRLKLNKKLGTKFNRDVSNKTYEIKEQVGDEVGSDRVDSPS